LREFKGIQGLEVVGGGVVSLISWKDEGLTGSEGDVERWLVEL
jgi:hypothetical protein